MLVVFIYFCLFCTSAEADIVFPAIAHQFIISMVVPFYYSVFLALAVLIIEGYYIKKFLGRGWFLSFIFAFVINAISSFAGVFIVTHFEFITRKIVGGFFGYQNMRWGTYIGMFPGYFLTVVIEWIVLVFITKLFSQSKMEWRGLLRLSTGMNVYSYLILLLGIIIVDILTKGENFKTF